MEYSGVVGADYEPLEDALEQDILWANRFDHYSLHILIIILKPDDHEFIIVGKNTKSVFIQQGDFRLSFSPRDYDNINK